MSSTVKPAFASFVPDCHQVNSQTFHSNDQKVDFLNHCAAWQRNVAQQPQGIYPSPHSHETVLQELPSVGGIIKYHVMQLATKLDGHLLSSSILGDHSR
jgi:hypothetical protein